ncbi:hypothetical protein GQ600_26054 [Phytophthora cactorum]|nr:hypothetical protein GQ600_26054 [Phytophthora cactorum]
MEGREWHYANYKEEKRMFVEKLQAPEETIRASKAAAAPLLPDICSPGFSFVIYENAKPVS